MCNNLEAAYNHHRLYKQHQQQFCDWLKETKQHIKAVQDVRGSKDNVNTRLANLDVSRCGKTVTNFSQKTLQTTCV